MKIEVSGCCFRIVLELFWLGREPAYRRYRIAAEDAAVRRRLLGAVRDRLGTGNL